MKPHCQQAEGHGPPEVASGGDDGAVYLWDLRQGEGPVQSFPADSPTKVCSLMHHA